jgi:hypothetical protein
VGFVSPDLFCIYINLPSNVAAQYKIARLCVQVLASVFDLRQPIETGNLKDNAMSSPFLLSRVLLQFDSENSNLLGNISAATFTPDGSLWVGSDELQTLERLSRIEPNIYGNHQHFSINQFVELFHPEGEVDIEGLDYDNSYLWLTGSHSSKRKKTKGKKPEKDLQKLATVEVELNRYMIARIPVQDGELVKTCPDPNQPDRTLTAAYLKKTDSGNVLIDALQTDPHLGHYMSNQLASKENGFDIEGLAVRDRRLFLGLRGPVLRGWAIILEIEVEESEPGILTLKPIGAEGRAYKKHFVYLNGLGIRELCWWKDELIILAGPTMVLEGEMQVFKLKHALTQSADSLSDEETGNLKVLFDLPFTVGKDHAEGLALYSCFGQSPGLMVVYDAPDENRKVEANSIYMDVFRLK